jgi:hypothetical protein
MEVLLMLPVPKLPQEVIDAQTKIAKIFAKNANVTDTDVFVKAWLNGYFSAMQEVGAIDDEDTDGENDLLKRLNKF